MSPEVRAAFKAGCWNHLSKQFYEHGRAQECRECIARWTALRYEDPCIYPEASEYIQAWSEILDELERQQSS